MLISKGYTLLEIVLIIVILGILAAIAVPKLWVTRDDAVIAKGRSEVATIRSAINSDRQKRALKGDFSIRNSLDSANANTANEKLFEGNSTSPLLEYPIYSDSKAGHWMKTGQNKYTFYLDDTTGVEFTYDTTSGKFDCDHTQNECMILTK